MRFTVILWYYVIKLAGWLNTVEMLQFNAFIGLGIKMKVYYQYTSLSSFVQRDELRVQYLI